MEDLYYLRDTCYLFKPRRYDKKREQHYLMWATESSYISNCLWHSASKSDLVWFHVEGSPGVHVYLRLPQGSTLNVIPEDVLTECCQMARQYSDLGRDSPWLPASVMYTMATNLNHDVQREREAMQGKCVLCEEDVRRIEMPAHAAHRRTLQMLRNSAEQMVAPWRLDMLDPSDSEPESETGNARKMPEETQAADALKARLVKIMRRQAAKANVMSQREARKKMISKGRDLDRRDKVEV